MTHHDLDIPAAPAAPLDHEATPMMQTLATLPTPAARTRRPPLQAIRPGRGVNQNVSEKPTTQFTEGRVKAVRVVSPRRGKVTWHLRYTDPDTGRDVKRRVAGDEAAARAEAKALNAMAYTGRGHLASLRRAPRIDDGIKDAIALSRGNAETKDDMAGRAALFTLFIASRFPAVRTWDALRPSMAEAYIRHCEGLGLARDSIRMRLAPVKAAWRLMHADYPELVKAPPALRLERRKRREIVCLEAGELARLLDWLKAKKADFYAMACLQGLAGLRMLEVTALRLQDVDLKAGTVTVTKTEQHTPKTESSYRTIPVCGEVVEALKAALAIEKKVFPATGEIFTTEDGELWKRTALSHRWTYTLRRAAEAFYPEKPKKAVGRLKAGVTERPEEEPPKLTEEQKEARARLLSIPARKLRAAFATMAGQLGASDRTLKAYIGHAPGDVLGGHYRKVSMEELRSVSRLMEGWRAAAEAEALRKQSGNNSVEVVTNA